MCGETVFLRGTEGHNQSRKASMDRGCKTPLGPKTEAIVGLLGEDLVIRTYREEEGINKAV